MDRCSTIQGDWKTTALVNPNPLAFNAYLVKNRTGSCAHGYNEGYTAIYSLRAVRAGSLI